MRIEQYKIAGHVWSARDTIFTMYIQCEKKDLNNALNRLRKRNKDILSHLKISVVGDDAEMQYDGTAKMWQDIEDVFFSLSDNFCHDSTRRVIKDPSLMLERLNRRKKKKPVTTFYNPYLGITQMCLN